MIVKRILKFFIHLSFICFVYYSVERDMCMMKYNAGGEMILKKEWHVSYYNFRIYSCEIQNMLEKLKKNKKKNVTQDDFHKRINNNNLKYFNCFFSCCLSVTLCFFLYLNQQADVYEVLMKLYYFQWYTLVKQFNYLI